MAKRVHKKTLAKKTAQPAKREKPFKKMGTAARKSNLEQHWEVYLNLQKQAYTAWAQLEGDVKRRAHPTILLQDRNRLLLLLGECNYLAEEYEKMKLP